MKILLDCDTEYIRVENFRDIRLDEITELTLEDAYFDLIDLYFQLDGDTFSDSEEDHEVASDFLNYIADENRIGFCGSKTVFYRTSKEDCLGVQYIDGIGYCKIFELYNTL